MLSAFGSVEASLKRGIQEEHQQNRCKGCNLFATRPPSAPACCQACISTLGDNWETEVTTRRGKCENCGGYPLMTQASPCTACTVRYNASIHSPHIFINFVPFDLRRTYLPSTHKSRKSADKGCFRFRRIQVHHIFLSARYHKTAPYHFH